ncbi:MAG: polyprenyl synthetase family protein [Deltaproteobacteria bacterium]|nr:polyprenyl synthetase family protein [Candidatus Anaeroferrophillus wilburensis]MBN2889487.1 polyprenyl synthetase family protein [Deltaproteobacteria bacterium]
MTVITGINDVFQLIDDELKQTEAAYSSHLQTNVSLIPKISEHIILSGGKRLRPALLILTMNMLGGKPSSAITLAAVIEFIHTATLLHDDVVDQADMRRGLAAANTIWGNEASVLVGDFLFSTSFDLAVDQGNLKILKALSSATRRLAEGEILELMKTADVTTTENDYLAVIEGKTAILMAIACEIGALLADTDTAMQQMMKAFGLNLGMAFQMVDDVLDYTSREEELGKAIGIDLEEGKLTLPLIHTLNQATEKEKQQLHDIILADFVTKEDFVLVHRLISRYKGVEFTLQRAATHVAEAKNLLMPLPPSPFKEALLFLADYVLQRDR